MKREGRHHGNAKAHPNKAARYLEKLPTPSSEIGANPLLLKPSNGSKFTGSGKCKKPRCRSCHYHPVNKSKDKAKGSHKLKSCDVALNHRLVSWRVVGDDLGILDYKGASASAVLRDLAGSTYSSNYSCDDAGDDFRDYRDRAKEVGCGVHISSDYGGSFNNSIDNSSDFIEFGALFDEAEAEAEKHPSDTANTIQSSTDLIEFGNLFDDTENKHEYTSKGLIDSASDFIGFGGLFNEIESSDFVEFAGLFDEIESSDFVGFHGLFDEITTEEESDVGSTSSGMKSETEEEEEEEDDMGYYIVGVTYEFSDGEDWLVVDEM